MTCAVVGGSCAVLFIGVLAFAAPGTADLVLGEVISSTKGGFFGILGLLLLLLDRCWSEESLLMLSGDSDRSPGEEVIRDESVGDA